MQTNMSIESDPDAPVQSQDPASKSSDADPNQSSVDDSSNSKPRNPGGPRQPIDTSAGLSTKSVHSEESRAEAYAKRVAEDGRTDTPEPIKIENTDIIVLCKLALTDPDTRAWLTAERHRMEPLRQMLETDALIKLWGADYDVSTPTAVSVYLSSLPAREEAFYTELLMKKTPGNGLEDARRSLLRLEIREVENRMEIAKGKLRSPGLADSVMTQAINEVLLLKKELVEKQKQLSNSD